MDGIKGITDMPDEDLKKMWNEIQNASDGMRYVALLMVALNSGTFEIMKKPHTFIDLAMEIGIKKELAEFYCESLVRLGFLQKSGEQYVNDARTNKYLVSGAELDQRIRVKSDLATVLNWVDLLEILRNGPSDVNIFDPVCWVEAISQRSLNGQVCKLTELISVNIEVNRCFSFLDIGGGHGLYSIGIKSSYPHIECTVLDRLEILEIAKKNAAKYNADLNYLAKDFEKDELQGSYDIVYSSFTSFGSDEQYVGKAKKLLNDNGYFIIRRHRKETSEDPIINLEWNFKSIPDYRLGRKRWEFDAARPVAEYVNSLTNAGMQILLHCNFDSLSEIIIAKKCTEAKNKYT